MSVATTKAEKEATLQPIHNGRQLHWSIFPLVLMILLVGNVSIGQVQIPVGALAVIAWAFITKTSFRQLGFNRLHNWKTTILISILAGIGFKLLTKALILPLLGVSPINHTYHYLAGNKALLPFAIWAMLVAGFAEETVFRGFFFYLLESIWGNGKIARTLTIGITTLLFAFAHYSNQGWDGVIHAAITGLVFGIIYNRARQLIPLMIIHAVYDLTALFLIYYGLEEKVAHLVF